MATDSKEIQAQLDLQMQINNVLAERQGILQKQQKVLTDQVQLAAELCKSLRCENLDDLESSFSSMTDAAREAANEGANAGDTIEEGLERAANSASKTGSAFSGISSGAASAGGAVFGFAGGVVSAIGGAIQSILSMRSALGGIVGAIGKVGGAIIRAPFAIMKGLIGMSQQGGGVSPLRQELENIRKEFGDLATNEGAAAVSAINQFRKQASDLAGTGKTLRRTFGPGRQGLAKALAYNVELMKALGPAMGNFSDAIRTSAVELAVYRKGLGLSAEGQASILKHAQAMGKDPVDAQREFASMAIQMGESFGISSKLIGKDMDDMKKDFATFGTLSTRELAQVSVYTRKLGIEVKDLQGLVGQFDNFEDAAQNAAKLAQSFGLNVDAMKLMNAQNPAERLSILQKAFKETGRSVEQMSRQELALLASRSGLSAEAAKLAFSQRGLSMSYDEVQKAGGKAEKKQLTQAEAMEKLANNIERVFGSGGGQFTSFFDAFTKGFGRGIRRSVEFRKVMRNIRKSLRAVFWAGSAVGRMFVKFFPGIKKVFAGLSDLFSPKRFGALMEGVKGAFGDLFKSLQTDPRAGVEAFFKRIKSVFKSFFDSGGDATKSILSGAKEFGNAILSIIQYVLPIAIKEMTNLVNKLVDLILNPPSLDGARTGGNDFVSKMVETFGESFALASDTLVPALIRLFKVSFEKAKPFLIPLGRTVLSFIIGQIIITGTLSAIQGAIVGFLGKKVGGFLKGVFGLGGKEGAEGGSRLLMKSIRKMGTRLQTGIPRLLGPRLSGGFSRLAAGVSRFAGPVAVAVAIGTIGTSMSDMTEKIGSKLEKSFGKTAMQAGIYSAGIIDAITLGLIPDDIVNKIAEFTANISSAFLEAGDKFLPAGLMKMIRTQMDMMFNIFTGIGDIINGIINFDFEKVAGGIGKLFDAQISFLKNMLINLPSFILSLIPKIIVGLTKLIVKIGLWIVTDGIKMLAIAILGVAKFVVDSVMSVVKFFTDDKFRDEAIAKFKVFGEDLVDGVREGFHDFAMSMGEIFFDAWLYFKEFWGISSPSKKMAELGQSLVDGVISTFTDFSCEILRIGKEAWAMISDFFGLDTLMELGTNIVTGIIDGMSDLGGEMKSTFENAWNGVKNFFGISSPSKEGASFGTSIVDGIMGGLSNLGGDLLGSFGGAFGSTFDNITDGARGLAGSLAGGLSDFASEPLQAMNSAISEINTSLSSFANIGEVITEGVSTLDTAFTSISEQFSRFRNDPDLALAVEIGRSLSGDGTLTVQHENLNVNLTVNVQMSARDIGAAVLTQNRGNNPFLIGKKFATNS